MIKDEIEIVYMRGVEGNSLYINNYRVAGPKPWGGGDVLETWKVERSRLVEYLKNAGIISMDFPQLEFVDQDGVTWIPTPDQQRAIRQAEKNAIEEIFGKTKPRGRQSGGENQYD